MLKFIFFLFSVAARADVDPVLYKAVSEDLWKASPTFTARLDLMSGDVTGLMEVLKRDGFDVSLDQGWLSVGYAGQLYKDNWVGALYRQRKAQAIYSYVLSPRCGGPTDEHVRLNFIKHTHVPSIKQLKDYSHDSQETILEQVQRFCALRPRIDLGWKEVPYTLCFKVGVCGYGYLYKTDKAEVVRQGRESGMNQILKHQD